MYTLKIWDWWEELLHADLILYFPPKIRMLYEWDPIDHWMLHWCKITLTGPSIIYGLQFQEFLNIFLDCQTIWKYFDIQWNILLYILTAVKSVVINDSWSRLLPQKSNVFMKTPGDKMVTPSTCCIYIR